MGKGEPTLFERLETESEKSTQEDLREGEGIRHALYGRVAIAVVTIALCAIMFPTGYGFHQFLAVGSDWQYETLVAEYPFPIYKPEQQYSTEVLKAREQALPVFTTSNAEAQTSSYLESVLQSLTANVNTGDQLSQVFGLSAATLAQLNELPPTRREPRLRAVCAALTNFQRSQYAKGFMNVPRSFVRAQEIIVRVSPSTEQVYQASQLIDSSEYRARWERMMQEDLDELGRAIASDLQPKFFQPNLIYSAELTETAARLAGESVPRTTGIVRKGEKIIARGERLTESTIQKISSSEYTRYLYTKGTHSITAIIGNIVYAAFIYALLVIYLYIMRKRIYYDNAQLLAVSIPLVAVAFMSWQSVIVESPLPLQYGIMIPVLSMLLAITFDSRTTFTTTVAMALLMAAIRSNDYNTAIGALLAGTFAAYTVRDLRSRTQIFQSIAFIFIGYAAPVLAIGLKNSANVQDVGVQLLFAAVSAVLSPILTLGLLYLIERLLNITTDLRLLEYDNLNHALIKELNLKAPGTYQHTLMVARLAESAAVAIEANPTLVKVGAYFHDIGKMRKAEYFVENQINVANKHDRLPPAKSANIIRQHVEEGLELAADYKLPKRIMDFIPMHHGTMLIRYFYVKALDDAEEKGVEIDEEDFRYPGPKPNSRETGILMLADAVEAVSHTIDTNDRDVLEEVIDKIVEERLLDKQLDESDLTMRDLTLIKESFVKNLLGTGHQRVKYKEIPREEDNADIGKENGKDEEIEKSSDKKSGKKSDAEQSLVVTSSKEKK